MKSASDRTNTATPAGSTSDVRSLKQLNAQLAAMQNIVQDFGQPTMPQWISFSTTTFCNLRCPHCQTHGTDEVNAVWNAKRWSNDLVERLGRESLPYAYEFNLSLNGEPLATPRLKQRLREFRDYGAKLHLTTNGTLLSTDTLSRVLPIASQIHVSIDGATERTFDAIRLGARFSEVVHNIRRMTRACELFPWQEAAPEIRLACTVMASNVRDMPEMVHLAHFLGVPAVDFYDLVVFHANVRDEDLKLNQPLYNAYRERTQREADRLGVAVYMPAAFPDVAADADAKIEGTDLILGQLPDDYYDRLPPLESVVDLAAIEKEAEEVVSLMLAEQSPDESAISQGDVAVKREQKRIRRALDDLGQQHAASLQAGGEEIAYCQNLFERTFINAEGEVSPCCMPGRPDCGNVNDGTLMQIYNGEPYTEFRRRFFSSDPPEVCVGCRSFISVPKKDVLDGWSPRPPSFAVRARRAMAKLARRWRSR